MKLFGIILRNVDLDKKNKEKIHEIIKHSKKKVNYENEKKKAHGRNEKNKNDMKKKIKYVKSFLILLFRSKIEFPNTLVTRNDFEIVLNHYLLDYWELGFSVDRSGINCLIIKCFIPFLKKRYVTLKKVISENKNVTIIVFYCN